MLAAAMKSLHFRGFLETYGDIPETVLTGIIDLRDGPTPDLMHTLERTDDYEHLMTCYDAYIQKTLQGDHGITAKYWIVYTQLVRIFMIFTRACRTNDVELFIYALQMMIPVYFSGNRPNYARSHKL